MKHILLLVMYLAILLQLSCGSSSGSDTHPTPTSDGNNILSDILNAASSSRGGSQYLYRSVGRFSYNGSHRCSGAIIKHGVFVTAKHCFRPGIPSGNELGLIGLQFPESTSISSETLTITGDNIKAVIMDDDSNDIAYITYKKELTESITIDAKEVRTTPPPSDHSVHLVGFPSPNDGVYRRLVSYGCKTTEKTGYITPKPKDPGYDGLLYDTDCIAWFGNSGGPIYSVDENGSPIAILGVVSHTFDIEDDGSLDYTKIQSDTYGSYVTSTNLSSFTDAKKLEQI